jgi:hypothetical protein
MAIVASCLSLFCLVSQPARWLDVAAAWSAGLFLVLDRSRLQPGGRRIAADLALLTPLLLVVGPLAR